MQFHFFRFSENSNSIQFKIAKKNKFKSLYNVPELYHHQIFAVLLNHWVRNSKKLWKIQTKINPWIFYPLLVINGLNLTQLIPDLCNFFLIQPVINILVNFFMTRWTDYKVHKKRLASLHNPCFFEIHNLNFFLLFLNQGSRYSSVPNVTGNNDGSRYEFQRNKSMSRAISEIWPLST